MKRIAIIATGIGVALLLPVLCYLIAELSYSEELPFYSVSARNDSILTIGIIGDSWVADNRLDTIMHKALLKNGLENRIVSSGQKRAKSKLIYQNLFKEHGAENSSRSVIESRPDYCIVIAGVNDATYQVGGHFYSYHMILIIKSLLHYGIRPVIVTLPEFGIEETINNMQFIGRSRSIISALIFSDGDIDNINSYRKIFGEEIEQEKKKDRIVFINFDDICEDYRQCPELYADTRHLSRRGSEKLVQVIVHQLMETLRSRFH